MDFGLPPYDDGVMSWETDLEPCCVDHGVRLAILFGSRAHGTARGDSDVDVAVWLDTLPSLSAEASLSGALRKVLGARSLDLVVLNRALSTTLRREIVKGGHVLYDRDGEQFSSFASLAMRQFADFAIFRERRRRFLREETLE